MSTSLEAGGWIAKAAMSIAASAFLGGGTMVLALHRNDAVQDEKIVQIQNTAQKIDKLDDTLNVTLREVAVLNAKLDQERPDVPRND